MKYRAWYTERNEAMTKKKQASKPTPKGAVELTEDSLDQVAGGRKASEGQKDYLKVTLSEVIISS